MTAIKVYMSSIIVVKYAVLCALLYFSVFNSSVPAGFIGLRETTPGVWEWDDGSPFDFTAWGDGEPNGVAELCSAIHWLTHSYWMVDISCSTPLAYFCQMPREGKTMSNCIHTIQVVFHQI